MNFGDVLPLIFSNYADGICYGLGGLSLLAMYLIFKDGGIKKPEVGDVWLPIEIILKIFKRGNKGERD